MFENLTGRSILLQTATMAQPAICGLLFEDDRGLLVLDVRGQKHWVTWPEVFRFEAGAAHLERLAVELHQGSMAEAQ